MVNISKLGDSTIKFTFTDNDRYLYNGEITLPLNSLILEFDTSDLVIFKKIDGDVFVTFLLENSNFNSKDELISWYETNMVGSTGGGGGVTPSQVQTMIDESISGKAESSAVTEEISAAVSGKANSSDVYTKSETSGATELATALSGKQDTLSAGRGISISSDTVSVSLPISAGTGVNSVKIGNSSNVASALFSYAEGNITTASSQSSHAEGDQTLAYGEAAHAEGIATSAAAYSHAEGIQTLANGETAHAEGYKTSATSVYSHAEGYRTITNNECEHASGQYNVSSSGSSDFGDSGNTLFSIGNGPRNNARHNAFEVRQNGDIYITSGGTDILLQDHLGGGGKAIEAGRGITVTTGATADTVSLNVPISVGSEPYSIQENLGTALGYYSHAEGLNAMTMPTAVSSHAEGESTVAGGEASHTEGVHTTTNNLAEHASGRYNKSSISSATFGDSGNTLFTVGNGTSSADTHNAFEIRQNGDIYFEYDGNDIKLQDKLDEIETVTAAALNNLNDRVSEDEEVTAAALNNLNDRFGGLKLQQISQSAYDNLQTKDSNTLYVIVN